MIQKKDIFPHLITSLFFSEYIGLNILGEAFLFLLHANHWVADDFFRKIKPPVFHIENIDRFIARISVEATGPWDSSGQRLPEVPRRGGCPASSVSSDIWLIDG